jgi:hypothetical protein
MKYIKRSTISIQGQTVQQVNRKPPQAQSIMKEIQSQTRKLPKLKPYLRCVLLRACSESIYVDRISGNVITTFNS